MRISVFLATVCGVCSLVFDCRTEPLTQVVTFPHPSQVRILSGPFSNAIYINRLYLLAHDPDRLLAPFFREAGLQPKAQPYANWERMGLDGHTAGHYLSALAWMIASGADTPEGELKRRLDYMISELARCQEANGNGYVGGVPGSKQLWSAVANGQVEAVHRKWVPWYNLHKTFAGLRDAYLLASNQLAREVLVRLADWCESIVSNLSEEQMQRMLDQEHGGMNEVLADVYLITGNPKYLKLAQKFNHRALLDPLQSHKDVLTGKHANTQIPKVVGFAHIATLTGDDRMLAAARFFWDNVTTLRSVAFGGNSVSEHFNDPSDFSGMIQHREGPETCNTYNMLRLTEKLFALEPSAKFADYYERALYNHILASIHPKEPGYVYFTPIRPAHYRVYSQPGVCFWCCVGTGMENPGRYGRFIYAIASNAIFVNLFIPSQLTVEELGLVLRQQTTFPDEARTTITLHLKHATNFTLWIRNPSWVKQGCFTVSINGNPIPVTTTPSSYVAIRRQWQDGDRVEVSLPMRTTVERLPDGSDWVAILHGPIVLAAPAGTNDMRGLRANDSRMGHVPSGPVVPLDRVPVLLTSLNELPNHVIPDPQAGPLCFKLVNVVEPPAPDGISLIPFFRLHDMRYQMYWELCTREKLAQRKEQLAEQERLRLLREANTLDMVAPGEQQSEVEHDFIGEGVESGINEGRRWRHGRWFQYTLDTKGHTNIDLSVTYWGGDRDRVFDILVNGKLLTTERLEGTQPGRFFDKQYHIPAELIALSTSNRLTVRFEARRWLAGGVYDVRLLKCTGH